MFLAMSEIHFFSISFVASHYREFSKARSNCAALPVKPGSCKVNVKSNNVYVIFNINDFFKM